ncbi:MAG: thiamine biosynthesis protein, partial [Polyangiales bacterium]
VEDGGALFETACRALPFADDAELAAGRLGEIALLDDAAVSDGAVRALRAIAIAPPSRGEARDPDGVARAGAALLRLSQAKSLPPARRALAISAARAFAERGALDPARIPDDLDPEPAPAPTESP